MSFHDRRRLLRQYVDQQLVRAGCCLRHLWLVGEQRTVEPGLAVHVVGDPERADQRAIGAACDRDIGDARERQHPASVERALLDRLIAVDSRHPQQFDRRIGDCQQQRHRVVMPGIAVEYERNRHRHIVFRRFGWCSLGTPE